MVKVFRNMAALIKLSSQRIYIFQSYSRKPKIIIPFKPYLQTKEY